MGLISSLGYVTISRSAPKLQVRVCHPPASGSGTTGLYVKRVGDSEEFALYPPVKQAGDTFTFQFDNLLFSRDAGRYAGRLVILGEECATIYFNYDAEDCGVKAIANPSNPPGCSSLC